MQIEQSIKDSQFDVKPFGSLVAEIADGLHGVRNYVDEGIVLLTVGNVTEFGLDLTDQNKITLEEHYRLKRSQVCRGDLLITITGRLGTALVYEVDIPANLSAHVARARIIPELADPLYLAAYFNSAIGKQMIEELSIGSIYPHINVNKLQNVRVIVPPDSIQRHIVRMCDLSHIISSWQDHNLSRCWLPTVFHNKQDVLQK